MNLPDSIFPDWFNTVRHPENLKDGVIFHFPMTDSRANEFNSEIIGDIGGEYGQVAMVRSLAPTLYLEGKGCLVMDHRLRKVYCCITDRASLDPYYDFIDKLNSFCKKPYRPVTFNGYDPESMAPIYHTDIMLAMLDRHVLCYQDALFSRQERTEVRSEIAQGGRVIIDLTRDEMYNMCGNMVLLKDGKTKELCLLMSKRARNALNKPALRELEKSYRVISPDIPTIETIGGGSVRCMINEIF